MMVGSVLAATVNRNMPSLIEAGEELVVTFKVSGAETGKSFTLEEALPAGLKIKSWDVVGAMEVKDRITTREKDNRFGWSFTAKTADLSITYKVDMPADASGEYAFDAVWFDPSGQSRGQGTLKIGKEAPPVEQPPVEQPPVKPPVEEEPPVEEKNYTWLVVLLIVILAIIGYYLYTQKKK